MKTKTGILWGLFAALLLLTARVDASTVSEIQFASFIGAGVSSLILTESILNLFASGGLPLDPSVTFLTSSVTVTAVPLPAAFWLLLSELDMLGTKEVW